MRFFLLPLANPASLFVSKADVTRAKMMSSGRMNLVPYSEDLRKLKLTAARKARADFGGFFDVASTAGNCTHPNMYGSQLLCDKTYDHKSDARPVILRLQGRGHDLWAASNNLVEFRQTVSAEKSHTSLDKEDRLCGVRAGRPERSADAGTPRVG